MNKSKVRAFNAGWRPLQYMRPLRYFGVSISPERRGVAVLSDADRADLALADSIRREVAPDLGAGAYAKDGAIHLRKVSP